MGAAERPPGFWLPWWLVEYDLTWSARLVYARLAFYPRAEDGTVWCRQDALAAELGMGRRTVQRALDDLDAAGLLVKVPLSAEDRLANRCQRYVVHAPDGASEGAKMAPPGAPKWRPVRLKDQGVPTKEGEGSGEPSPAQSDQLVLADDPGQASSDPVLVVFNAWSASLKRAGMDPSRRRLTPPRRKAIRARLREGYSVEDLCAAAVGWLADPWPERPQHNDLTVLLKPGNVERMAEFARNGPTTRQSTLARMLSGNAIRPTTRRTP